MLQRLPRDCPLPGVLSYTATGQCGRTYHGTDSLGPAIATMTFTFDSDPREKLREIERW